MLAVGLVAAVFATLMVRLATMREGYRLSELRAQIADLKESNRTLRLKVAELTAHDRLRALAVKYRMTPPARGQVVVVP